MRDFRKYDFWRDGVAFSIKINSLTKSFPVEERFALADQLRRSALSIPSNVAEGAGRNSDTDFAHFIDVAIGSAFETETQLGIAKGSGYISEEMFEECIKELISIERRLNGFLQSLRKS